MIVNTVANFAAISLDCEQKYLDEIQNAPYVYLKVMKTINVLIFTNPEFTRLKDMLRR